jgi:MFS family permease
LSNPSVHTNSFVHQLSQLNWIVSAFNLTSATFIPTWGQFADVFGRYTALQIAIITMLVGSTLCAGAPVTDASPSKSLTGCWMCRSCDRDQGLISDKVSLRENAKNNTVFAIFGGIGYEIGPIIGGYLAQASWRCCFIINIPIGVIGLVLVHFLLRSELLGPQPIIRSDGVFESQETPLAFTAKMATIDFGGQFLFLFGMGLLVLAFNLGWIFLFLGRRQCHCTSGHRVLTHSRLSCLGILHGPRIKASSQISISKSHDTFETSLYKECWAADLY